MSRWPRNRVLQSDDSHIVFDFKWNLCCVLEIRMNVDVVHRKKLKIFRIFKEVNINVEIERYDTKSVGEKSCLLQIQCSIGEAMTCCHHLFLIYQSTQADL